MTPLECQRVAQAALFMRFAEEIDRGWLSRAGLRALRARLLVDGEFEPGVGLEMMRLVVSDALGLDVSDRVPDDASSIASDTP